MTIISKLTNTCEQKNKQELSEYLFWDPTQTLQKAGRNLDKLWRVMRETEDIKWARITLRGGSPPYV